MKKLILKVYTRTDTESKYCVLIEKDKNYEEKIIKDTFNPNFMDKYIKDHKIKNYTVQNITM